MKIRSKTFRNWMKANFNKGELRDMVEHGVDTGWQGLTYYRDTIALYNKFADEIWEALYEDAEAFGSPNIVAFIGEFKIANQITSAASFKNALVWYMAERIARQMVGEDY
jgi:hypothetical protein